ncbi:MAG TPA: endopeptidase La [Candidatus Eubacterium avistercoris]|uniref:endopeptidase La n=1 Tax=Candidatus Eubacterium avistercoris TaxID=2838567 RepID=A0A9D2D3M1_9FIRM|nr:endopeptidase La [Candidatus Eubacterium avistercoris]
MIYIPIYNAISLPDVSCYFQKEYLNQMSESEIQAGDKVLFMQLKEEKEKETITGEDIYPIAVWGEIESIDGDWALVHTTGRVNVLSVEKEGEQFQAELSVRPDIEDANEEDLKERFRKMRSALVRVLQGSSLMPSLRNYVMRWKNMNEMIAFTSSVLQASNEEKYAILEEDSVEKRAQMMEEMFYRSLELYKVKNEAQNAQEKSNEKIYREQAIRKQMDFLQKELDELHPENMTDIQKFEKKVRESGINETARKEAEKVLNRMKQEGQEGHEYGMLYDYMDFITSLEWKKEEPAHIDLGEARKILDEEHYGLKKTKERIIQQIAVMELNKRQSGSILLFVGAPGTGKTSIGQSIAKALKRSYVRVSLGGVRDEAEIRGHRRTYIGAMPGRIMEGIKRSGVSNPVMVLDEVDKLTKDYGGDPSSALLEVLDPEQNSTFTDHYLNVPYDLSDVLFVCTANTTDTIPEPLLNRMEVISFTGYSASEKFRIATDHLLPKAMEKAGINPENLEIDQDTIRTIISDYTMEAGVRGLKNRLDTICRAAAVKIVSNEARQVTVKKENLRDFLDLTPIRHDRILETKKPGIVTGLAWTQAGGEILFIETMFTKGSGKAVITGRLGDVMKESVQIAVSLVKEMYPKEAEKFEKNDLHIHVPSGAVPKDGPSAGITLTTALASLVTGRPVNPEYAMTGEVSLRGVIMPIGGLPEKLMAAQRAGVKQVFIPEENVDDLRDVAQEVKDALKIVPVHQVSEVLDAVFQDSRSSRIVSICN